MNRSFLTSLAGLALLCLSSGTGIGQTAVVADNYNVTGSGSGFALNTGVNSGINPPATRLTGSVSAGLRYFKYAGTKADSLHTITGSKLSVGRGDNYSTLSLTPGSGLYDFSAALGAANASAATPAIYEFSITMANSSLANQRCGFGISSDPGGTPVWDFGVQIFRNTTSENYYTIQKRIDTGSSGLADDLDSPITTTRPGTWTNGAITFLVRVTDAGVETASFSSRVQVSTNGGSSWVYDTRTDPALTNGWRFDTAGRYFFWDISGWAIATYDSFSLNWVSGPRTWIGAGTNGTWSNTANWGGVVPTAGNPVFFSGSTRQASTNDLSGLLIPWLSFNNGGFTIYGNTLTSSSALTNLAGNNTFKAGLAWGSTAVKTWSIASGSEVLLDNITTIETNGDHFLSGGGTLRLKGSMNIGQATTANPAFIVEKGIHVVDAGNFNSRGGYRIGANASSTTDQTTLIITNNANFTLTDSAGNLRVGNSTNTGTGRLEIADSSLALSGGALMIPYTAGATGVVSQVGGIVSGGAVRFSESGAGTGSYTIQNGTLQPTQILKNNNGGRASISFDNATLRPHPGASSAFFTGLDLALMQAGGLTVDATSDLIVGQVLSGSGALTKNGSAQLTLNGASTFSGGTLLNTGTLSLGNDSALGTGTLTINGGVLAGSSARQIGNAVVVGGNFTLGGAQALTLSGNVNLGSSSRVITVSSTADAIFSGILSGTGGLTKEGSGLLQLSGAGANTFSGSSIINAGTLSLAKTPGLNAISADVTIGDGVGGEAADILRLNAANQLADSAVLTIGSSGLFDLNGFSETVSSVSSSSSSSQIALGSGTLTLGDANSGTFAGSISGTGDIAKQGSGTWTLTGASSYSGTTTIGAGCVNVQNGTALGSTGATIVNSGAAVQLEGGITVGAEPLTLNGAGISAGGALQNVSDNNNWSGAITLGSATKIASDSGTLTISGNIGGSGQNLTIAGLGNTIVTGIISTGTGTLTKQDTGTCTLAGANTYTGNTTISAGTLAIGAGGTIASSPIITIANGATLNVSALSSYVLAGTQTLARNATSGTAAVNGSLTFNTGAQLSLLANGPSKTVGTLNVTGNLTLNGNVISINVSGGALDAGSYPLVSYTGTRNGTFNLSPTITGSGLKAGMQATILETTGAVTLKVFAAETDTVFRVMSYNMHYGNSPITHQIDTTATANYILAQNVDLVALNEVDRFKDRSNNRDLIAELSQKTGYAYVFSNHTAGTAQTGNAILSKHPILARDFRLLPKVGDNEQRAWLKAIVDIKGKYVSFWATHLDFHADNTERLLCADKLNLWVADETVPTMVCGDFNDTPNTPVYDRMEQEWADIWMTAGDGTLGRTAPCPPPLNVRIDYIWKAKGTSIKPTNAFVGYALEASDHYAVLTDFILTSTTDHATGFAFPLNEGAGTNVVDSIGGLKGILDSGAPVWKTNSPSGQSTDYSLYFNGSKKLTVQDPKQILGTNGFNDDYTLQTWVKVAVNYAPAQRAIMFQYERRPGFSFSINTNRTLHTTTFKVKDVSSAATLPNDGNWHHVAVVHTDGENMKFYIDGALSATVVYTNGCGYRAASTITLGSDADGANPFTGYLDRVQFVNRALTQSELDYQAGSPRMMSLARITQIETSSLESWKATYKISDLTSDVDGDGQSNYAEYVAKTNPTNATSVLRVVKVTSQLDGRVVLTWSSVGGVRYRIQYAESPEGPFTDIERDATSETDPNPPGLASEQSFVDISKGSNSLRFYRIKVLP